MFQDVIELQAQKVTAMKKILETKSEITFKSPTGSGKTYMMANLMDQIIKEDSDVVFIVSTLSKSQLAEQNQEKFEEYANNNTFPNLNSHLISSEITPEARLTIPETFNVYVLARDLYKDKSRLKDTGAFEAFLIKLKEDGKKIYVIKDECHQATNNLDSLSNKYFDKTINISATPDRSKKQIPDVEMTEIEAQEVNLIKRIVPCDINDSLESAIKKFQEIKKQYHELIGINPCMIIQISNKDKAKEEIREIKSILEKSPDLKWMFIVDKDKDCDTNDIFKKKKVPVIEWKNQAKGNHSTIDIIIFKMVITEGWDIPRACMLYQMRPSQSKQLDEQVVGRVRRNPKLVEFDKLSDEAKKLAMSAFVWGVKDKTENAIREVKLVDKIKVNNELKLKTTRLKAIDNNFIELDIKSILKNIKKPLITKNFFDLFAEYLNAPQEVKAMAINYCKTPSDFFDFVNNIDLIIKKSKDYNLDYEQNMELTTDEYGNIKEVCFPTISYYTETDKQQTISKWIWKRTDDSEDIKPFSFDSEAEKEWVNILIDLMSEKSSINGKEIIKDIIVNNIDINEDENKYLFGKNFTIDSEIKYEYYLNGIHSSYPDFIMKDWKDRIHLFETKSLNKSLSMEINNEEYEEKIEALKNCYKHASKLTGYLFYIPIKRQDKWIVIRYENGIEKEMPLSEFRKSLKN